MSEAFIFARYVCSECATERPVTQDAEGVYSWSPCADHPEADSRLICYCGEDEMGCAVSTCDQRADVHVSGPNGSGWYGMGVCDTHLGLLKADPQGHWEFSRHVYDLDTEEEAMELAGLPA